ncbi:hypothetical protein An17g00350 [Aspergillus niger]|uniref:Uncharacterized protein n=2 Tax=Aspergillus niger TaxID=5061 RepID=A2R972_ASPNC|nr:hypothetical protein An17g00350 [Aspergillus niger]CAK97395.1 hypothetical protein An17g00350 [Aspergillus niger]
MCAVDASCGALGWQPHIVAVRIGLIQESTQRALAELLSTQNAATFPQGRHIMEPLDMGSSCYTLPSPESDAFVGTEKKKLKIHTRFSVSGVDLLGVPIGDYESADSKGAISVHWIYYTRYDL